jgi:pteridine reductase
MDLKGRVALVTGAGRRVGRAIALRLAAAGCGVAVHYRRSQDEAAEVAAACRRAGGRSEALPADLEDASACESLVAATAARFGRLDALINNAAQFEPMSLDDFDLRAWERTLRINLTAPMLLSHAARELLRAVGGRIVNLCDAGVDRPWPNHLAYCVSKAALEALTRSLAAALAPAITVVGIAPGVAAWPEHYDDATRNRLTARIPLRRAGTVDDIAGAVHFVLAEGDYITGTIIPIDGGRRLV